MAYCPHCNVRYDETNETQPCCHQCGHPISCGCGGGHSYSPSPSVPPSVIDDVTGGDDERGEDESEEDADDTEEETFSPGDELPF